MTAQPIRADSAGSIAARHGLDWHYRERTESTNADVLNHYRQHRREVVAVSEAQSAGRGRRGRQWHSPYARNIYCTIGLLKTMPANRQGLLSILTGLALCRALETVSAARIELKWPNDLLAAGRKLGGILIESQPHDEDSFFFAIGFGINVFMDDAQLDEIAQPVTSLDRMAARALDRTDLLEAAIEAVVGAIREFDETRVAQLVEEFRQADAFHGREVEVISAGERILGINRGISPDGELRLETGAGLQLHSAAEISLKPVQNASDRLR